MQLINRKVTVGNIFWLIPRNQCWHCHFCHNRLIPVVATLSNTPYNSAARKGEESIVLRLTLNLRSNSKGQKLCCCLSKRSDLRKYPNINITYVIQTKPNINGIFLRVNTGTQNKKSPGNYSSGQLKKFHMVVLDCMLTRAAWPLALAGEEFLVWRVKLGYTGQHTFQT